MSDLPSEERMVPDIKLCETLMNSIRGIVWEADPLTFQFTYVSSHAERLLGYPARQWIDVPDFWRTHTHSDDVEWTSTYFHDASTKGVDHEFEYRMIAADGRIVWLHDIVTVARSDDGAVRLRGIMFDITERKLVEEALAESEEWFHTLCNSAPIGIFRTDDEGTYLLQPGLGENYRDARFGGDGNGLGQGDTSR